MRIFDVQNKNLRISLIVISIIIAVAFIVSAVSMLVELNGAKKIKQSALDYFVFLEQNQVNEAYNLFSSGFQAKNSLADFQKNIISNPFLSTPKSGIKLIVRIGQQNDSAFMEGQFVESDKVHYCRFHLLQEGGTWKIDYFKFQDNKFTE